MVLKSVAEALVMTLQLNATAMITIATPMFVVIAADSKVVSLSGEAKPGQCKILNVGSAFYAANKFVEGAGYDLRKIVARQRARSVGGLATDVRAEIEAPLKDALTASRREDVHAFNKMFESTQAVGIVFAGFENGGPVVTELRFSIDNLTAKEITLRVDEHGCPGTDCTNGYAFSAVPSGLLARFAKEHPRFWEGSRDQVAANAEAFINLAIKESPSDVGGPISVLVLNGPKPEWRQAGRCTE